jgi:hypothetical protein
LFNCGSSDLSLTLWLDQAIASAHPTRAPRTPVFFACEILYQ